MGPYLSQVCPCIDYELENGLGYLTPKNQRATRGAMLGPPPPYTHTYTHTTLGVKIPWSLIFLVTYPKEAE